MLCRSCQKQPRCLPAQFAQVDPTVATLLDQLQDCSIMVTPPVRQPSPLGSLIQRVRQWWQQVRQSLSLAWPLA